MCAICEMRENARNLKREMCEIREICEIREMREMCGNAKTRNARCKEHHIYLLILRSYRLESQCLNHHVQSARFSALARLVPISITGPPLVLADLLVSYLNCYGSVHFGPERAPYI
jgi:hypothetical protein